MLGISQRGYCQWRKGRHRKKTCQYVHETKIWTNSTIPILLGSHFSGCNFEISTEWLTGSRKLDKLLSLPWLSCRPHEISGQKLTGQEKSGLDSNQTLLLQTQPDCRISQIQCSYVAASFNDQTPIFGLHECTDWTTKIYVQLFLWPLLLNTQLFEPISNLFWNPQIPPTSNPF